MQTRLSSNMQEPALLWHKSASELRQREQSSFDSKWVRDSCQRHRGRLRYPTENCRLIGSDQFGMSHIVPCLPRKPYGWRQGEIMRENIRES